MCNPKLCLNKGSSYLRAKYTDLFPGSNILVLDTECPPDMCMVMEVLGSNLLKPIVQSNYKGLAPDVVKWITYQVLLGVDYLHRFCGIIHTDIKPENILLCVSDEYIKKLALGGAKSKSAGNIDSKSFPNLLSCVEFSEFPEGSLFSLSLPPSLSPSFSLFLPLSLSFLSLSLSPSLSLSRE